MNQAVTGWRAWAIRQINGDIMLCSPARGDQWPAEGLTARCTCHGEPQSLRDCPVQCGVRIWRDMRYAQMEAEHAEASICGQVQGSGDIRTYEKAYLASICTVVDLDAKSMKGISPSRSEATMLALTSRYGL